MSADFTKSAHQSEMFLTPDEARDFANSPGWLVYRSRLAKKAADNLRQFTRPNLDTNRMLEMRGIAIALNDVFLMDPMKWVSDTPNMEERVSTANRLSELLQEQHQEIDDGSE